MLATLLARPSLVKGAEVLGRIAIAPFERGGDRITRQTRGLFNQLGAVSFGEFDDNVSAFLPINRESFSCRASSSSTSSFLSAGRSGTPASKNFREIIVAATREPTRTTDSIKVS